LALIAELLGGSPGEFYDDVNAPAFYESPQQGFTHLTSEKQRLIDAFDAIPTSEAKMALLNIADQMAAPHLATKS